MSTCLCHKQIQRIQIRNFPNSSTFFLITRTRILKWNLYRVILLARDEWGVFNAAVSFIYATGDSRTF